MNRHRLYRWALFLSSSFFISLFIILAVSPSASAMEVTRFGPKKYVCEKGTPQVFTDTFSADRDRGWLIVENGDTRGHHRVSGAVITLNGKKVFGPWAFNHHDRRHKSHVHLRENNTVSVKVHGRPGSYLTIWVMQDAPIELTITSPENGATVSGLFLRVEGTIMHPLGSETGIIVYPHNKGEKPIYPHHGKPSGKGHHHPYHFKDSSLGVAAMVYGDQFVASHVPVQEGRNVLAVIAIDTDSNVAATSVKVTVVIPEDYIRITADTEMGISPLETTLRIEGTFSFTHDPSLTYTGPGDVEVIESLTPTEYRVRMTAEGIYYFTAEATGPDTTTYTDTVSIMVLNKEELDALLRTKWEGMKAALINQDLEPALKYFAEDTQGLYRDIYTALGDRLPQIIQDMQEIQLIYAEGRLAKYRIRRNEEHGGQVYPITYYIYFVRNGDGLWKIYRY